MIAQNSLAMDRDSDDSAQWSDADPGPRWSKLHPALAGDPSVRAISWGQLATWRRTPIRPWTELLAVLAREESALSVSLVRAFTSKGAAGVPAAREDREVELLRAEVRELRTRLDALERSTAPPLGPPPEASPIMMAGRWLDQHGDAYQGRWVALRDGELMGSGHTLDELESDLKSRSLSLKRMFVTRVR